MDGQNFWEKNKFWNSFSKALAVMCKDLRQGSFGHPGPPSHWTLIRRMARFEVLTSCKDLAEFWMAVIRLLNGRDFIAGKGALKTA